MTARKPFLVLLAIAGLALGLPNPARAQAYETSQDLMFQALNQNMWGGSGPGTIAYNQFLGVSWNTSLSLGGIAGSPNATIIPGGCFIWCWDPVTGDTRTGLQFTGNTDGRIGLQVGAEINAGTVDVSMPVSASLSTASSMVAPGAQFSIFTDFAVDPLASLETRFPSIELYADFVFDVYASGTGLACFVGAGCSTSTGTIIDVNETLELLSLNRDGSNEVRVLGIDTGLGSFSVGPVDITLNMPNLETSDIAANTSLSSSGDVNVVEAGVDIPRLVAEAILPGSGYLLSGSILGVDYSVLSTSLGPRFGIGQDFSFTSTPMVTLAFNQPVSRVVGGVTLAPVLSFDAALGSSLDLIFPLAGTLDVTPTYWLQNALNVSTDFLTRLGLSVDILSMTIPTLGTLGPVYEADFQTSALSIPLDDRQFALQFDRFQGETFHMAPVPEPSTWIMLGTGLLVMVVFARRRRRVVGMPD